MRFLTLFVSVLALAACGTRLHGEPKDHVREMALEATPIGSSIDDVRRTAANFLDQECRYGTGLSENAMNRSTHPAPPPGVWPAATPVQPPLRARPSITACVGCGWSFPFRAYTWVTWYFDANGLLVDVEVQRGADSL